MINAIVGQSGGPTAAINASLSGVIKACHKRPVDPEMIVNEVEQTLYNDMRNDITTSEIGELVMLKLKEHDQVAYVRFASVYREFKDVDTFLSEINKMIRGSGTLPEKKK